MECKKFFWSVLIGSTLLGCSSEEVPEPEYIDPEAEFFGYESEENIEEEINSGLDEQDLLNQGFRKGTLTVDLSIQQSGSGEEREGPDYWSMSIQNSLTISAEKSVWLPPEFNEFVPYLNDPEFSPTAWQVPPYYEPDQSGFMVNGTGSFSLFYEGEDPLGEMVYLSQSISADADVSYFRVTGFEPSLFGKGYELDAEWYLNWNVHKDLQVGKTSWGEMVKIDNARRVEEMVELNLLPTINRDGLNPYPLTDENDPEIEGMVRETMEFIYEGYRGLETTPALASTRAGLITELNDDRVVLTYRYSGPEQVIYGPPDASDRFLVGQLITLSVNSMDVKVTLKADG